MLTCIRNTPSDVLLKSIFHSDLDAAIIPRAVPLSGTGWAENLSSSMLRDGRGRVDEDKRIDSSSDIWSVLPSLILRDMACTKRRGYQD